MYKFSCFKGKEQCQPGTLVPVSGSQQSQGSSLQDHPLPVSLANQSLPLHPAGDAGAPGDVSTMPSYRLWLSFLCNLTIYISCKEVPGALVAGGGTFYPPRTVSSLQ